GEDWQPRLKLSEQAIKISTPGMQNIRRFTVGGQAVADVIWDELHPAPADGQWQMVDPQDPTRRKRLPGIAAERPGAPGATAPAALAALADPTNPNPPHPIESLVRAEDLLEPVLRGGRVVYTPPPLSAVRARTQAQLALFHGGIKRLINPHRYPVGLEHGLHTRKTALILAARGAVPSVS
ncbi:MAG: hypothetical protein ACREJ2_07560, partial [Planctomycetota bacterium]